MSKETPPRGYLLDTHIAVFSMFQSKTLSPESRETIARGRNFLSVISYWEVMLKSRKGKLDVGDPRVWWQEALEQLAATVLPLRPEHVAAVYGLAQIHKDPFDRMLIAQATVEGLALVSADAKIHRYASRGLRIVK